MQFFYALVKDTNFNVTMSAAEQSFHYLCRLKQNIHAENITTRT